MSFGKIFLPLRLANLSVLKGTIHIPSAQRDPSPQPAKPSETPDVVIILPICPKIWQLNPSLREEASMLISRGSLHPTSCTKIAYSSSLKLFDSVASGTRRMV